MPTTFCPINATMGPTSVVLTGYIFAYFWTSYKWNNIVCAHLYLAFFLSFRYQVCQSNLCCVCSHDVIVVEYSILWTFIHSIVGEHMDCFQQIMLLCTFLNMCFVALGHACLLKVLPRSVYSTWRDCDFTNSHSQSNTQEFCWLTLYQHWVSLAVFIKVSPRSFILFFSLEHIPPFLHFASLSVLVSMH